MMTASRGCRALRLFPLVVLSAALIACNGGQDDDTADPSAHEPACAETGPYACLSGETEPLHAFQWALEHKASYFSDYSAAEGGFDLDVASVHRQGIKGQGVNVLVLDTGTDLHHEDLVSNADFSQSKNLLTQADDPISTTQNAHGTAVAGIIGAAQNGLGVMGIAPQVTLGAANYLEEQGDIFEAYGGASWSSQAHIINASYGWSLSADPYETAFQSDEITALRGLKSLRSGKGALFVKSAGNEFAVRLCGTGDPVGAPTPAYYGCVNPANDREHLEPNVIVVAALSARGVASSYSSAGPLVWVTGMGGEYGSSGVYGEDTGPEGQDGPTVFSTDIRGCSSGYSKSDARTPFLRGQSVRDSIADNSDCDYAYLNGTSAAAPTISGIAALMLSANPNLGWRDVRNILMLSARKVDAGVLDRVPYRGVMPYGSSMHLPDNQLVNQRSVASDIRDGATHYPLNLGWQKNGAGFEYSDRYGFGVPSAEKAVALALEYAKNPQWQQLRDVHMPGFTPVAYWQHDPDDPIDPAMQQDPDGRALREGPFPYGRITKMADYRSTVPETVDQFQLRLTGQGVCLGSLGMAVKSPAGTVSVLKRPNDHFRADTWDEFSSYALGSYAFYGEQAQGEWEIYLIASTPDTVPYTTTVLEDGQWQLRQSVLCPTEEADGSPREFGLMVDARVIAQ